MLAGGAHLCIRRGVCSWNDVCSPAGAACSPAGGWVLVGSDHECCVQPPDHLLVIAGTEHPGVCSAAAIDSRASS